ncbi:Hypothetical Protein SLY_0795 [Strawberry lethal yellows phytoplasma (CPA) str. NZSb11]|uniref:Uncharacterized protein n=1 Tax=Strawberry lethal yellows phytoplasma (CPA) str. NZSb11 TaxID=980422 RepID=R4RMY5_PHYAS|nr:Hypothetical Protein SLY_0795 [Strawberry lethal yellows phytoplasma (CPA) str. NZSb11]
MIKKITSLQKEQLLFNFSVYLIKFFGKNYKILI